MTRRKLGSQPLWLRESERIYKAIHSHSESSEERKRLINVYLPWLIEEAKKVKYIREIILPKGGG